MNGRNQPGQEGTGLNSTVNIMGSDYSLATIIIVFVGVLLAFGTSWLTGLWSRIGISAILIGLALYVAYSNRNLSFVDAIMTGFTVFIIFKGALWFLANYLPDQIVNLDVSGWDAVKGELGLAAPFAEVDTAVIDPRSLLPSDTIIYSTPIPVIPGQGGGYEIPGTGAGVTVAATADPLMQLVIQMNTAAAEGNLSQTKALAQTILDNDPTNGRALAVMGMVTDAERALSARRSLPTHRTVSIQEGEALTAFNALQGGTYVILDSGAQTTNFACQEIATIQEQGGFLDGEQYRVKRCLLDQFDVSNTGDVFSVQ